MTGQRSLIETGMLYLLRGIGVSYDEVPDSKPKSGPDGEIEVNPSGTYLRVRESLLPTEKATLVFHLLGHREHGDVSAHGLHGLVYYDGVDCHVLHPTPENPRAYTFCDD